MKRLLQISVLVLFAVFWVLIIKSYADTHTAESCSQAHVQAAIDEAARGDTVSVPAGSCTWSTSYTLTGDTNKYYGVVTTKAIKIQGAGIDSTNITVNLGTPSGTYTGYFAIIYATSSASDDANVEFDVSGFTFDDAHTTSIHAGVVWVKNWSTTRLNKIKIHDNKFLNCYGGEAVATDFTATLLFEGTIAGVVYSNSFYGLPYFKTKGYNRDDDGRQTWDGTTYSMGSDDAIVFENNTLTKNVSGNSEHQFWSSQGGAAYVVRYNTVTNSYNQANIFNMHAIQRGGTYDSPTYYNYATMAGEFYGNYINNPNRETFLSNQGGGRCMMFYNYIANGTATNVKYIVSDSISDTYAPTNNTCNATTNYPAVNACSSDGERQRITKTYFFNNRKSSDDSLLSILHLAYASWNDWGGNKLLENYHYWKDSSVCSGSNTQCQAGVGCGTLANRPQYCVTGTGYWATDQACSGDLSDYVGASPTTPLSGTLYRCTSTNKWNAYYSPLAYPHPLRTTDPVPPADTSNPVISNFSPPYGTYIACTDTEGPPYTEDVPISFMATDQTQTSVVCKWDTNVDASPTYAELSNTFDVSGTTFSDTVSGITCGTGTTIFYACTDGSNTTDVSSWSFNVTSEPGTTPTITNITLSNQSCSMQNRLRVETQTPSTCRFCTYDGGDCTAATAWADRTQMSVTGSETIHHEVSISQACSSSVKYEILCQDSQGNESSNLEVTITTDAAKSVAIGSGSLTVTIGSGANTLTVIP